MQRRSIPVVVALAALAAVAATSWLLFREDFGGAARRETDRRAATEARDDPGRASELPPPQRVELDSERTDDAKPALASDFDDALARAGLEATAGPADGLEVALVERRSRAPRPDVAVLVFAGDRPRATEIWQKRLDPKWLKREHPAALRSDANGKIRVELPGRGALLVAENEEERGVLFLPEGTTAPATLELGAPLEVPVRVVDGGGAGKEGVAVAIARSGRSIVGAGVARATTDASGLATLHDLDLELNGRATTHRWWVGFALPLGEASGRDVELEAVAAAPVELVLPPTGTLTLQVVGSDGSPLPIAGSVTLSARRAVEGGKRPHGRAPHGEGDSFQVPIAADGSATLAHVGVGLHFEVGAALDGRQPGKAEGDGPARAGERAAIAIPAGAAGPIVSGRALDGAKRPLADADLVAGLVARDPAHPIPSGPRSTAHTDGEGRFAFDLSKADARARSGPATLSIARPAAEDVKAADANLDLASLPESLDVGDIEIAERPLLCSGRVVDDRGDAVGGATVELVATGAVEPAAAAPLERCRSHASGRFELRGTAPAGPAGLEASERGYANPPPLPFEQGAEGVVLVLPRAGEIVGSLRLPENVPGRSFRVALRRLGSDAPTDFKVSAAIGSAGDFRFERLAAGTFDVRVGLREAAAGAAASFDVTGIEVHAGETVRDARLAAVDVSQLLRLLALDVRDEQDHPVASGRVASVASGSTPRVETRLRHGRALLAGPADSFDVEVLAAGFQPLLVAAHPGALALVLKRGLSVHVVAALDHPRDPDAVLDHVTLVPAGAEPAAHAPATRVAIGATGEGDAVVPLAGRYVARLEYRRRSESEEAPKDPPKAPAKEPMKDRAKDGAKERPKDKPRKEEIAPIEVACEVAEGAGTQTLRLAPPR